ncbi:MAG: PIG-T family GPI transamidase component [Flavobacteriaceae bacterium]|nr:PIG-T family GPI transamidase component [Flavobacteriaceae bacterium]
MKLEEILSLLHQKQHKKFIRFLENREKAKDSKGLQLYVLMTQSDLDKERIARKLYPNQNFVAYRVLRKRLSNSVLQFLAGELLQNNYDAIGIRLQYYLVARYILEQGQRGSVAISLLQKAEKLAIQHEDYALLYDLYNTQLEHAHQLQMESLAMVKQKARENFSALEGAQKLSMFYADVRAQLYRIRHQGEYVDMVSWYQSKIREYGLSDTTLYNFKAAYQLTTILSLTAFVVNDYGMIVSLLEANYQQLQAYPEKQQDRYYRLQVLYHMANLYFRTQDFERAQFFLDEMATAFADLPVNKWQLERVKQQNLQALCLHYTGQVGEAIALANHLIRKKITDLELKLDIRLSLVMYHYHNGDLQIAFKLLQKFNHSPSWYMKKAGKEWAIRKAIIEIMLAIDLEKVELAFVYFESFKRLYYNYLKASNLHFVVEFLRILEKIFLYPDRVKDSHLVTDLDNFQGQLEQTDVFMRSFYAWPIAKIRGKDLYRTTLKLMSNNKES